MKESHEFESAKECGCVVVQFDYDDETMGLAVTDVLDESGESLFDGVKSEPEIKAELELECFEYLDQL